MQSRESVTAMSSHLCQKAERCFRSERFLVEQALCLNERCAPRGFMGHDYHDIDHVTCKWIRRVELIKVHPPWKVEAVGGRTSVLWWSLKFCDRKTNTQTKNNMHIKMKCFMHIKIDLLNDRFSNQGHMVRLRG